ncbi:MAG: acetyl-CoA carboxylase biotin carboxyl carrier protein [Candidatus Omnitrophica bacterium]|nr:acetyl-CoA carboxylase biotin carboxyl carrier protein [Candidatus Omnitrophota bacterium]
MNIKEIKEMIQLMNENSLTELELEKEGLRICLRKSSSGTIEQISRETAAVAAAVSKAQEAQAAKEAAKIPPPARTVVRSPMVGTFYASPAPDAPAFVQVGSQVEVGQVICIIEAMKLMNEIKSEFRGKVVAININNGDPVEFGQPLFLLE